MKDIKEKKLILHESYLMFIDIQAPQARRRH